MKVLIIIGAFLAFFFIGIAFSCFKLSSQISEEERKIEYERKRSLYESLPENVDRDKLSTQCFE